MTANIYASIYTLLIVWLSLKVIEYRRKYKISLGDAGNEDLRVAIGAHSNAVEYLPIALILMYALEFNEVNAWLIHLFGISLFIGRMLHARGLFARYLKYRVLGMQFTIFSLIGLAIVNIGYVVFAKMFVSGN